MAIQHKCVSDGTLYGMALLVKYSLTGKFTKWYKNIAEFTEWYENTVQMCRTSTASALIRLTHRFIVEDGLLA